MMKFDRMTLGKKSRSRPMLICVACGNGSFEVKISVSKRKGDSDYVE